MRSQLLIILLFTITEAVNCSCAATHSQTIEQCVISTEQTIKEIRPQWTDSLRSSVTLAMRHALENAVQTDRLSHKAHIIRQELPVLLNNLPSNVQRREEEVVVEKVRWYIITYLARQEYKYETQAIRNETVRQQIATLMSRMVGAISEDMPQSCHNEIILAVDRLHQRCSELAGRKLAPILKEPLTQAKLEEIYKEWERKIRPLRAINRDTMSSVRLRSHLKSLFETMLEAIWMSVDHPDDLKNAVERSNQAKYDANKAIDSCLEKEANIQAQFGNRLEIVEHWGNVIKFIFLNQPADYPNERVQFQHGKGG